MGNASGSESPLAPRSLVEAFIADLNAGNAVGAADRFDAERYVSHSWGGDLARTWEAMKASFRAGTWTDPEVDDVVVISEGPYVARRSTFRATHAGEFLGVPATGRRITFYFLEMWRVDDGKIVEHWGGLREAERLYQQLTA